ncbi:MAG: leucine--tRNA ligase [Bacteroidia bacterium]
MISFAEIDKKWQAYWKKVDAYEVPQDMQKPKFYILDMFPYPSGAGLHVGHPLGYIATDILARYKRLNGYAVLHPMGYDSFGLPAENYALRTGIHPAISTEKNIQRYQAQMERLGLGYPQSRILRTSDPAYYRWTQWIFLQFFKSWYDTRAQKARPIEELIGHFETQGTKGLHAACSREYTFSAQEWKNFSTAQKSEILMAYRLAYTSTSLVNWCPALGTVLANEEVKDGLSERGGHPVYRIPMRQWFLRVTAYAERLLQGLATLDWPEPLKEMQRNWIGRSEGAYIDFRAGQETLRVFTTRPDTVFGCTFLVIAPEHPLREKLTHPDYADKVQAYVTQAQNKLERDRISQNVPTGVFLGTHAEHPFTGEKLPIWTAEYVLAHYGTGAIMAVPAHDLRDWHFAKRFDLPIRSIIQGADITQGAYEALEGTLIHSDFLDGLTPPQAIKKIQQVLQEKGLGAPAVQYKLRDAVFSRQRYWGEPFPIVWHEGVPQPVEELPVVLPQVETYQPTGTAQSPLARIETWVNYQGGKRETDTMPGWAGSSWYFLRYVDPHNTEKLADFEKLRYWLPVDLYVGGAEHAVGHLLYARFWMHFLYDLGHVPYPEPFHKLVNQGMILGRSCLIYKEKNQNRFVSFDQIPPHERTNYIPIHVEVSLADEDKVDIQGFKKWMPEYEGATFVTSEDGSFRGELVIEKMSKSFHNVVTPDELCDTYGADTFRLYEMFLGPLNQPKPWNPRSIQGVHQFLMRLWRFCTEKPLTQEPPSPQELYLLHYTIKRVTEDIERLSLNTCVSHFMIFLNRIQELHCHKRAIWEPFIILLSPFAPHITQELWYRWGHTELILDATWPKYNPAYLHTDEIEYPISINGKLRLKLSLPSEWDNEKIQSYVLSHENLQKHLKDKTVERVVIVPKKIINLVVR